MRIGKRKLGHRSGASMDARRHEFQHLFRDIETPNLGSWILGQHDARKSPFAAPNVKNALAGKWPEVLHDQADMINPRIDRRRKVFLIARSEEHTSELQ